MRTRLRILLLVVPVLALMPVAAVSCGSAERVGGAPSLAVANGPVDSAPAADTTSSGPTTGASVTAGLPTGAPDVPTPLPGPIAPADPPAAGSVAAPAAAPAPSRNDVPASGPVIPLPPPLRQVDAPPQPKPVVVPPPPAPDPDRNDTSVTTDPDPVTRPGGAPDGVNEADQLNNFAHFQDFKDDQRRLCSDAVGNADCVKVVMDPPDAPTTWHPCSATPAPQFGVLIKLGSTVTVHMKADCDAP